MTDHDKRTSLQCSIINNALKKNFSTSHRVYHIKFLFLNLLTPHSRSDCGNIVNDISGALKRPNLLCKYNCKGFYSHIPKDSITQNTSEVDLFNLVCHYCKWYFMNCEDSFLANFFGAERQLDSNPHHRICIWVLYLYDKDFRINYHYSLLWYIL